MYIFQSCKYYFYLTIIDSCRYLYPKTHYLLSDFFDQDIEPSDSLPIFKEMLNLNMQVYYITVSLKVYTQFYNCSDRFKLIFGVRKINGNILEKFLELFLRLKVVVAAEKYESIDNLFYNIEYIKIGESTKFGIEIYKYNGTTEEIESSELFFFTDKSFNFSFNKN